MDGDRKFHLLGGKCLLANRKKSLYSNLITQKKFTLELLKSCSEKLFILQPCKILYSQKLRKQCRTVKRILQYRNDHFYSKSNLEHHVKTSTI